MSNEHEAVRVWRDTFKLNLKLGFKEDIVVTVTDLEAWKALLTEWKEKKWNPLSIKEQLSEYERRLANERTKRHSNKPDDAVSVQRQGLSERSPKGVSEWWHGSLLRVR